MDGLERGHQVRQLLLQEILPRIQERGASEDAEGKRLAGIARDLVDPNTHDGLFSGAEYLHGPLCLYWNLLQGSEKREEVWSRLVAYAFPPTQYETVVRTAGEIYGDRFDEEQYDALQRSGHWAKGPTSEKEACEHGIVGGLTWNHPIHTRLAARFPRLLEEVYNTSSEWLSPNPGRILEAMKYADETWKESQEFIQKCNQKRQGSWLFCVYPRGDWVRDVHAARCRLERQLPAFQRFAQWMLASCTLSHFAEKRGHEEFLMYTDAQKGDARDVVGVATNLCIQRGYAFSVDVKEWRPPPWLTATAEGRERFRQFQQDMAQCNLAPLRRLWVVTSVTCGHNAESSNHWEQVRIHVPELAEEAKAETPPVQAMVQKPTPSIQETVAVQKLPLSVQEPVAVRPTQDTPSDGLAPSGSDAEPRRGRKRKEPAPSV